MSMTHKQAVKMLSYADWPLESRARDQGIVTPRPLPLGITRHSEAMPVLKEWAAFLRAWADALEAKE